MPMPVVQATVVQDTGAAAQSSSSDSVVVCTPVVPASAQPVPASAVDTLRSLAELRDQGCISQEEFESIEQKLRAASEEQQIRHWEPDYSAIGTLHHISDFTE